MTILGERKAGSLQNLENRERALQEIRIRILEETLEFLRGFAVLKFREFNS